MDDSSVRVAVRIRPQIPREIIDMCRVCTSVTPGEPQVWMGSDKAFTYDYVFDMDGQQESVYDTTVKSLVDGCFEGYNATVLAYGQTGSGKTYTMGTGFDVEVPNDTLGIIPRAVEHLFRGVRERQEAARQNQIPAPDFKINAQFMELYNEEIIDLLDQTRDSYGNRGRKTGIKIHEDSSGDIYTVGVTTRTVVNEEEALGCLRTGALSRTTASTQMNVQSSRSHAIFTLHIKQQRLAYSDNEDETTEFETLTAKFHFVDLAGSERLKRTGATGERAKEGISINSGLLALGNVISALGDKSKKASHVPYRDSKLTRLLQDSLGGNSRTLMIACVSPSDRDFMETLNTLKYANRARNIKNKVTVNQDKNSKTIALLRQEIQKLQLELMEYKQGKRVVNPDGSEAINDMYHENTMLQSENQNFRTRIKALQETVDSLKARNVQLQVEKETGKWITGAQDSSDSSSMTELVAGYLKEIEDLRTNLLESEHTCQQIRKTSSPGPFRSPYATSQVAITGHYDIRIDDANSDIDSFITEAKKHVLEKEQMLLSSKKKIVEEEEDEEESSDSENKENENMEGELAELQSDINLKQKLIEELEMSQRRLQTMKQQYEDKLLQLQERIKATQEERDRVLTNMNQAARPNNEVIQKIKTGYETKLNSMQKEMKKLQAAKKEHGKLLKEQGQYEKQLKTLKSDLTEMKKAKVKLMNKMKEESSRHKEVEMKKSKEIAQLRKEHRRRENEITKLQAEKRLKDGILRRKQEEVQQLRKNAKPPLSERVAGRLNTRAMINQKLVFSPKAAKQKWQVMEKSINKIVLNKQTIAELEQDMERWLKEREKVRKDLERLMKTRDKEIMNGRDEKLLQEYEDDLENLKSHMLYVNDNIQDCQTNITQMDSEEGLENGTLTGTRADEADYLLQKVTNMVISQSVVSAQKDAKLKDLELKNKQLTQDLAIQEEILQHLLLKAGDSNKGFEVLDEGSGSSGSASPSENMFDQQNPMMMSVYGVEAMNSLTVPSPTRKARRKTATTDELLYFRQNGNMEGPSLPPPFSPVKESPPNNNYQSYKAVLPKHPTMNFMSKSLTLPNGAGIDSLRMSPTVKRKLYSRQESYSPKPERRAFNFNTKGGTCSGEVSREASPPPSPTNSRRGVSRDENVFSRLTGGSRVNNASRIEKGRIYANNSRHISKSGLLVCTHTAEGHSKAVLSLAATTDRLFSGSKDRTVKVWDLKEGCEVESLGGHPNNVTCVRYAPRSTLLFSTSANYIKVWDLRVSNTQCIKTLASSGFAHNGPIPLTTPSRTVQMPHGETSINDVVLSSSENFLYSAVADKVRVWDLRKFQSVGKLSGGHQAAVMCLAIDSINTNQHVVVTGSKDHYIKVFDVDEKRRNETCIVPKLNLEPPHYDGIECLAVSGDILFSGSRDTTIKKWDLSRSEQVQIFRGHKDWVSGVCFLPVKRKLLSACRAGSLKLWDVETGQLLQDSMAHSDGINALATNQHSAFTASNSGEIKFWGTSMSVSTGSLFQLCL